MLVPIQDFYKKLHLWKTKAINSSLLLLVPPYSCDALCATKILVEIFKASCINSWQIECVINLEELSHLSERLDKISIVIMINFGGIMDLFELLDLESHNSVMIFVFDPQRPYNTKNIDNQTQIFLMDDGTGALSLEAYGLSAAGLMYALATEINKAGNDLLWLAIVGLTDQFVHQHIDRQRYLENVDQFRADVMTKNMQIDENDDLDEQTNTIQALEEFAFMLLRHWNLYDSMYHTREIAVKLGFWKARGKRNLEVLFARMGIPLEQATQVYSNVSKTCKQTLSQKLKDIAPKFQLERYSFPSFFRKNNFSLSVSAADVVYGVTAILETVRHDNSTFSRDSVQKNFWLAYDALQPNNVEKLEYGFSACIEVQKAIVRQAVSLLQKKQIVDLQGSFRYAIINDSQDIRYFGHPITLGKLAQFLVDTLIEMGKGKKDKSKPFLLAALSREKYYLIVGVPGIHSGAPKKQSSFQFGYAFEKAAKNTGIILHYKTFDTSVVEVEQSDIVKFIEYLRSGLVRFS